MTALYIIAGIIGLIILIVLIAPLDFSMERSVAINKPKDEVFAYLKLLKNQDKWSVWNLKDPNMKQELKGIDGQVGAVNSWDSQNKNVGKGAQEIIKITEGERIDMELRFEKPMNITQSAHFTVKSNATGQTEVEWGFKGRTKRPMNVMFPMMKGMILKEFDQGLANLKNNLEK